MQRENADVKGGFVSMANPFTPTFGIIPPLQKLAKVAKTCKNQSDKALMQRENADVKGGFVSMANPFTPTFGIIPPFMAGRESLIEDISAAFSNGIGDPNLATIISGARGTGKTAMLSFMAEEASSQGWIAANTTAADGMLEDILEQANRRRSPRAISSKRWGEDGLRV